MLAAAPAAHPALSVAFPGEQPSPQLTLAEIQRIDELVGQVSGGERPVPPKAISGHWPHHATRARRAADTGVSACSQVR